MKEGREAELRQRGMAVAAKTGKRSFQRRPAELELCFAAADAMPVFRSGFGTTELPEQRPYPISASWSYPAPSMTRSPSQPVASSTVCITLQPYSVSSRMWPLAIRLRSGRSVKNALQ